VRLIIWYWGSAPARQFVVNYNDVCHFGFSCSDYTSTSQIILYESSNFIDVNIIDKPICTEWNDGLAVVGIQNIDDTIAFTPEDRNTSAGKHQTSLGAFLHQLERLTMCLNGTMEILLLGLRIPLPFIQKKQQRTLQQ
jgi:hypothetical protein